MVGGDLRAPRDSSRVADPRTVRAPADASEGNRNQPAPNTPDAITERLLATGGIDFLLMGAEAMGAQKMKSPAMLKAAARALLFYLDPDHAGLFDIKPPERHVDPKRLPKGT